MHQSIFVKVGICVHTFITQTPVVFIFVAPIIESYRQNIGGGTIFKNCRTPCGVSNERELYTKSLSCNDILNFWGLGYLKKVLKYAQIVQIYFENQIK